MKLNVFEGCRQLFGLAASVACMGLMDFVLCLIQVSLIKTPTIVGNNLILLAACLTPLNVCDQLWSCFWNPVCIMNYVLIWYVLTWRLFALFMCLLFPILSDAFGQTTAISWQVSWFQQPSFAILCQMSSLNRPTMTAFLIVLFAKCPA